MTGAAPRDLLIPADMVEWLRGIVARCLDRGEGTTDQQRDVARLDLVGAMDGVLGRSKHRAGETGPGAER